MYPNPKPPVADSQAPAEPSDMGTGIARSSPGPPADLLLALVGVDDGDSDVGTGFTRQFAVGTPEVMYEYATQAFPYTVDCCEVRQHPLLFLGVRQRPLLLLAKTAFAHNRQPT
jgi:hypothetical protein